jgi:hypothetical protein
MMSKTAFGSTVVAGISLVLSLAGCGGGGGHSSAAKTATMCTDYVGIVQLDNSNAGGSIAFYSQMGDGYKKLQGEAPKSLHSALQVLIDDEKQLAKNGTDSSSQNDAAQAAASHVDSVLGPMCAGAAGQSAPSFAPNSGSDNEPGLDVCANLRKYAGEDSPVYAAECENDGSDVTP